jgi:hypothetical protein
LANGKWEADPGGMSFSNSRSARALTGRWNGTVLRLERPVTARTYKNLASRLTSGHR